jgi:hypothetical protein
MMSSYQRSSADFHQFTFCERTHIGKIEIREISFRLELYPCMLTPEQLAYWLLRAQCARTTKQLRQIHWELGLLLEGEELALVRSRIGALPSIADQLQNLNRHPSETEDHGQESRPVEQTRRPPAVAHLVYPSPQRRHAKQ